MRLVQSVDNFCTEADESLQVLKAVIHKGWLEHKSNVPSVISPYFAMRDKMRRSWMVLS